MTHLWNNPKEFAADELKGFTKAFADYVELVHGGVVRSTESPSGQVAMLVGGGSGHYPAFAGWVGPGMAHGAVCGNIFASPSASQAVSVAHAADNGGGILYLYGNYAGDVLQFGQACEELKEQGVDARMVMISDDIASNSEENHRDRRGIAGDLMVVKVTGAAIAEGYDLDRAEEVAWKSNDATRSLGVAFTGCTLPGATEPLFEVEEGTFGLGLGIHGEPGISSHDMMDAEGIAGLLVDGVLKEEPAREGGYTGRVAVLLNGLGATKYEELFVLYGSVSDKLEAAGLTIVGPQVGEHVTSLDMAGVSLTVMFLDDELERLWLAGADTPAFRTGQVDKGVKRSTPVAAEVVATIEAGSEVSAKQGAAAKDILAAFEERMIAEEAALGKLDTFAGDGDHGQGMVLGTTAARKGAEKAVEAGAGLATVLDEAGKAWAEGAGGTSGALWGNALREVAKKFDNENEADDALIGAAIVAGAKFFAQYGGASVGDKTMVDASDPYAAKLDEALGSSSLAGALKAAVAAADEGAKSTEGFAAKKGRARTHGEKSIGHADPGAVSFSMIVDVLANTLK